MSGAVNLSLPLVNQLAGSNYRPPTDGLPDNNENDNCGEADFCAIVSHFGGPRLDPDAVKDAVLGPGASGAPSSMDSYGAEAARYGLAITKATGDAATLLGRIRAELAAGHPVVILIPSMWGLEPPPPQGQGSLHFVVFSADDGAGHLTAMNPWGGFYQTQSYAWWQERIRDGAIWVFAKVGSGSTGVLSINDPAVTPFFSLEPSGAWHCKQTGCEVGHGILAFYQSLPAAGTLAGLTALGLPLTPEIGGDGMPSGVVAQVFERGCVVWDPHRAYDAPPGSSGGCYLAHIDRGPALDHFTAAIEQQLADAKSALTAAAAALAAAQAQDATDKAAATAAEAADATDKAAAQQAEQDLAAAQSQVSSLTAQVAALQQQLAQAQADGGKGAALLDALEIALGLKPAA